MNTYTQTEVLKKHLRLIKRKLLVVSFYKSKEFRGLNLKRLPIENTDSGTEVDVIL